MSQTTIDYINGQIVNKSHTVSGDIKIKSTLLFNNGTSVTGEVTRDINGFDLDEAQNAADGNAITILIPGVDFILPK